MISDRVAVQIIAGQHTLAGALDHSSSRVLDVLNNASTEFLRIERASICRGIGGAPIGEFDEITIPKSSIECLVLKEDHHEAPLQRKYALVEKDAHTAFVLFDDHELRGQILLGRAVDPILLLGTTASNFFPIVSATIASTHRDAPQLTANVVFVNKHKVATLHINQRVNAPPLTH